MSGWTGYDKQSCNPHVRFRILSGFLIGNEQQDDDDDDNDDDDDDDDDDDI